MINITKNRLNKILQRCGRSKFLETCIKGDFCFRLVESIESKIKDATGVDLNEELVDLVKYQSAYKAAAQVFNTCNSCLDILMSLGG